MASQKGIHMGNQKIIWDEWKWKHHLPKLTEHKESSDWKKFIDVNGYIKNEKNLNSVTKFH